MKLEYSFGFPLLLVRIWFEENLEVELEAQSFMVEVFGAPFMYVHVLKEAFSRWLCESLTSHSQRGNINLFQR